MEAAIRYIRMCCEWKEYLGVTGPEQIIELHYRVVLAPPSRRIRK